MKRFTKLVLGLEPAVGSKRFRRKAAAGARPPGGAGSALGAVLVITLLDFAFGREPVFSFMSGRESATL